MSVEARDALNSFAKTLGVSRAAILELTIREFAHTALARRHGLKFNRAAVSEMAARLLVNSKN